MVVLGMRVEEKYKLVGVDCPSCVLAINRSLKKLRYIEDFRTDPTTGEAVIIYDPEHVTTRDIVRAIREAGYDVFKKEVILMTDAREEAPRIEEKLARMTGVIDCSASPITGIVRVVINPVSLTEAKIVDEIRKMGFKTEKLSKAYLQRLEHRGRVEERRRLYRKLASFILGLALVIYYSLPLIGLYPPLWGFHDYVGLIVASIVLLLNTDLVRKGYKALLLLSPVMDSLIALSTTTTFIYSVIAMTGVIPGAQTYFEASAGVLGFVSMGEYIESRLRARAGEAIRKLMELQKGKVKVIRDGKSMVLDSEDLRVGDIVEVRAGEKIVVDGVVIDGEGWVDESTFTGEPRPVKKSGESRDPVLAGTILRQGFLRIKATRVGEDTSLAHIIESVKRAQLSKPDIQRIADKIVGMMTWAVIILSISTLIYWLTIGGVGPGLAVMFAASVLAVTCPCPLGIAIPLVIAIAVGRAAKKGLLIRDSRVFEKNLAVTMMGFDKTGTLTKGEPMVEKIVAANGYSEKDLLRLVCSIEQRSEHIIGRTITSYCVEKKIDAVEPEKYDQIPGQGVLGIVQGLEVGVGSEKLVEGLGLEIPSELSVLARKYRMQGKTVVFVTVAKKVAGLVIIGDQIRPEAREVIRYVRENMGIKTILITGDNEFTAKTVAEELGIDQVYAGMRPDDKADLIRDLQKRGERISYVGDGINDAVALTESFLGIAMGGGADIAKEAGEVIITNNKLSGIITLHRTSKLVYRKIKENLLWAFIYNATLVPIAMGILYKPMGIALRPEFAAVAMMASDISVILNSLSIVRKL